MKNPLKHSGYNVYESIQIHARQCKGDRCSVPQCKQLRQHTCHLPELQHAMDERRSKAAKLSIQSRQETTTVASSANAYPSGSRCSKRRT